MRPGNIVELKMHTAICQGIEHDDHDYVCELLSYDAMEETLSLILKEDTLTNLSLDAIYECRIKGIDEQLLCTGRITQRYCGAEGKIVRFQIVNGFYKNSIK